jgi:hypothetical protein
MKIGIRITLFLLIASILLLLITCDAPRNNPVDPRNPDNKLSTLQGTIKRQGFPFPPIAGINVAWENENIVIRTDAAGKYSFANIERKDGLLRINGDGFSNDSAFIQWNNRETVIQDFSLNSEPELNDLDFYSVVINKFQFNNIYEVVVKADISDFEGINDIDSVFIINSQLNIKRQLLFNSISRFYEYTFQTLTDLNVADLDEVIGKDFIISVSDLSNRKFDIATTNIKRVINEEVELISPLNNDTVSIPFTLKWRRFEPGFDFYFTIEIQTNENNPVLLYREENIPSDSISFVINDNINETNVFWTIWAIDEFNNRGRSKPGTFQIQE